MLVIAGVSKRCDRAAARCPFMEVRRFARISHVL
jgi:hypothetical protein